MNRIKVILAMTVLLVFSTLPVSASDDTVRLESNVKFTHSWLIYPYMTSLNFDNVSDTKAHLDYLVQSEVSH